MDAGHFIAIKFGVSACESFLLGQSSSKQSTAAAAAGGEGGTSSSSAAGCGDDIDIPITAAQLPLVVKAIGLCKLVPEKRGLKKLNTFEPIASWSPALAAAMSPAMADVRSHFLAQAERPVAKRDRVQYCALPGCSANSKTNIGSDGKTTLKKCGGCRSVAYCSQGTCCCCGCGCNLNKRHGPCEEEVSQREEGREGGGGVR